MACTENTESIQLTESGGIISADLIIDPDASNAAEVTADGLFVAGPNETGWFPADETWTYAGADAPTFTLTIIGNKTTKYEAGHRVKLTQTSTRYFIVTAVAYDAGTGLTTLTLCGGALWTLANATITDPYYSTAKKPLGFSTDPRDWTEEVTSAVDQTQAAAANGTWYNPGATAITLPIGVWDLEFMASVQSSAGGSVVQTCLSTANNSASDSELVDGPSAGSGFNGHTQKRKLLGLTTKTVYYLNIRTTAGGTPTIGFYGSTAALTVIRAICALL